MARAPRHSILKTMMICIYTNHFDNSEIIQQLYKQLRSDKTNSYPLSKPCPRHRPYRFPIKPHTTTTKPHTRYMNIRFMLPSLIPVGINHRRRLKRKVELGTTQYKDPSPRQTKTLQSPKSSTCCSCMVGYKTAALG